MISPLTLLAFVAAAGAEERVERSFLADAELAQDLADDRSGEDSTELFTRLVARAAGREGSRRWEIEAIATHGLRIGQGGGPSATWEARLGETGWEGPLGPFRLRVGHLVERWGRLDLLSPADILSPRDLRRGPLIDPDDARVPLPLARLGWRRGMLTTEATWIPFPALDKLSLIGTDWSLFRQGMAEGMLADASTWEGDALTTAAFQDMIAALHSQLTTHSPGMLSSLGGGATALGTPEPDLQHGDLALRIELGTPSVDAAISGAWMHSRQPLIQLQPGLATFLQEQRLPTFEEQAALLGLDGAILTVDSPLMAILTGEISTTLGPVGIRAEARHGEQVLNRQWMAGALVPTTALAGGLDWVHAAGHALTMEIRWDHLHRELDDLMMASTDQVWLALAGQFEALDQRLRIRPLVLHDLHHSEWIIRPTASWRPIDAWELELGALLLGGGGRAGAATWGDAMAWSGGMASYAGDADCLTLAVRWIQ